MKFTTPSFKVAIYNILSFAVDVIYLSIYCVFSSISVKFIIFVSDCM